ncbi:MAG: hypothetical protein QM308_04380 [Bacillota bacterium]|nr:hypothetical protein [Bacillota bacterium]
MTSSVKIPELLQLSWPGAGPFFGCDQDWFPRFWQRKAGCGSCTGANILHYFSGRKKLSLPHDVVDQESFVRLMEYCWQYLTPSFRGLNSPFLMQKGLDEMMEHLGCPGKSLVLAVPDDPALRPSLKTAEQFIRAGVQSDSPVAFLNLHNGGQEQLENWHWVTVVGIKGDENRAKLDIYDNGIRLAVDLGDWLVSAERGGGFVYVSQA